jgi:hypothetical protein
MRAAARLGCAPLAVALLACASTPAGWDVASLRQRHPGLDAVRGHALGHALPFFALAPEGLSLLLCRWSDAVPVQVWLPEGARSEEIAILEQAMRAWEGAGLGVRFESRVWGEESPPLSGIVFELVEPERPGASPTGSTIADCAVPLEVAVDDVASGVPVDAALHYASIRLLRSRSDLLGRNVALSDVELLGAAVHELGHALGFSGHVARGGSVMSRHGQLDAARRWGRRIAAGERLEAPSLVALYALPNGVRVGSLPLDRVQLAPLRAVSALGGEQGLRGPYVRVGDESARWFWRDRRGASVAAVVFDWLATLREPARLRVRLNRSARLLLESAGRL